MFFNATNRLYLAAPYAALTRAVPSLPRKLRYTCPVENGCIALVDDTYNSNPLSLKAALASINGMAGNKRRLRNFGADVVGMSTVPEVITARHMGMKVVAFSICTDMCDPDHLEEADIDTIIKTAGSAEPKLTKIVKSLVGSL